MSHRIKQDAHQFILEEGYWSKKHEEQRWRPVSYHLTLPQAVSRLLEREMGPGPWEDVASLLDALEAAVERVAAGLEVPRG